MSTYCHDIQSTKDEDLKVVDGKGEELCHHQSPAMEGILDGLEELSKPADCQNTGLAHGLAID